jgi:hypothetical protein
MTAASRRAWIHGMTLVGLGIAAVGALAYGIPAWMVPFCAVGGGFAHIALRLRLKNNLGAYVLGTAGFVAWMFISNGDPDVRVYHPYLLAAWLGMFWTYDWSAQHWPDPWP